MDESNRSMGFGKKMIKRENFESKEELNSMIMAIIDYFNKTLANLFKWAYQDTKL